MLDLLGNILWIIFGGFFAFLGYIVGGIILCITIIGIPFGLAAFRIGFATLAPFGKRLVESPEAGHPLRMLFNVIWAVLFGWIIAVSHAFWGAVLAATIIGLPFAWQHFKLIPVALMPFGITLR
jgi:uncharacterized membrane protein YccF (DUF307 family)